MSIFGSLHLGTICTFPKAGSKLEPVSPGDINCLLVVSDRLSFIGIRKGIHGMESVLELIKDIIRCLHAQWFHANDDAGYCDFDNVNARQA